MGYYARDYAIIHAHKLITPLVFCAYHTTIIIITTLFPCMSMNAQGLRACNDFLAFSTVSASRGFLPIYHLSSFTILSNPPLRNIFPPSVILPPALSSPRVTSSRACQESFRALFCQEFHLLCNAFSHVYDWPWYVVTSI